MANDIPLFEIAWDERDVENVTDSITRGGYWAKGPYVDEFEEEIESYLGVEHAVVVNSGTTALDCALRAHGIGEGDEVLVPSFTFIATANAVELAGATPVFVDIERESFGLDPGAVEAAITPETAAVVPVHPYGRTCRIEELAAICADHEVALIEDAAEAFGADSGGRMAGTFGDSAALSFCQNKIVPTGEGGAVVTDDEEVARRAELFRSHGRASADYFDSADSGEYVAVGTNFRMPDVVAAIGCAQMEKVEELIDGRRDAARRLGEGLASIDGVEPHPEPADGRHVYQLYTVVLDQGIDRERLVGTLADRGIASKVYWDPPIHRTTYYRGRGRTRGTLDATDHVAGRVLSLPMHPELSRDETDRIVDAVAAGATGAR